MKTCFSCAACCGRVFTFNSQESRLVPILADFSQSFRHEAIFTLFHLFSNLLNHEEGSIRKTFSEKPLRVFITEKVSVNFSSNSEARFFRLLRSENFC